MAQIDSTKSVALTRPLGPQGRPFGEFERAAPAIAPSTPEGATLKPASPHQPWRARPRPGQTGVSVATIDPADLDPLAELGLEGMIHSLARIEYALRELEGDEGAEGDAEALGLGREMVGESLRRLRLIQAGQGQVLMGAR
jgi:hypothetical protein